MKRKQDIRKHGERDEEVLKRLASKPIAEAVRGRLLISVPDWPVEKNRAELVLHSPDRRCFELGLAGGERGASASTRADWKQARCQPLSKRSRSGEKFVFK
ncbi:hypothetical protein [Paenibacillus dendritiformis]|uniref:hypothetical protein n=1 Tax=Paenibacillus dendritiformis TaxID=130049 RepID=UPI000DA8C1DD|nr:hypothetical protein [Paenibacillus dendritiformis]PZM66766.1 hypothetical protein DOE73_04965 [Paenibacillus dendritiformis]